MSWTARQREMLGSMGVRIWAPPVAAEPPAFSDPALSASTPMPVVAQDLSPSGVPSPSSPTTAVLRRAPPIPAGAEAPDWAALQTAVADCRLCNLHAHRRQALFGVGHAQSQWLIVADPPVSEDDAAGEPFAGAAGQLLDRMLAALRLTRAVDGDAVPAQRVYVANALRCLPTPGDHPGAVQWAACETHLVRQMALLQPRVVLVMGRFAAQALLRSSEPLGRLRERVHHYQGVPLIVTYHPAFLLRNPDFKAAAWEDLLRAARCFEQGA